MEPLLPPRRGLAEVTNLRQPASPTPKPARRAAQAQQRLAALLQPLRHPIAASSPTTSLERLRILWEGLRSAWERWAARAVAGGWRRRLKSAQRQRVVAAAERQQQRDELRKLAAARKRSSANPTATAARHADNLHGALLLLLQETGDWGRTQRAAEAWRGWALRRRRQRALLGILRRGAASRLLRAAFAAWRERPPSPRTPSPRACSPLASPLAAWPSPLTPSLSPWPSLSPSLTPAAKTRLVSPPPTGGPGGSPPPGRIGSRIPGSGAAASAQLPVLSPPEQEEEEAALATPGPTRTGSQLSLPPVPEDRAADDVSGGSSFDRAAARRKWRASVDGWGNGSPEENRTPPSFTDESAAEDSVSGRLLDTLAMMGEAQSCVWRCVDSWRRLAQLRKLGRQTLQRTAQRLGSIKQRSCFAGWARAARKRHARLARAVSHWRAIRMARAWE